MLSWECADLFEYSIVVYSRRWNTRSSPILYRRHFRVIVEVDSSISMMVVVMVMMRNRGRCVAGRTYWCSIVSILPVMVMARRVSSVFWDDDRQNSLMSVFVVMMSTLSFEAPCSSRTICDSPISDLGLL